MCGGFIGERHLDISNCTKTYSGFIGEQTLEHSKLQVIFFNPQSSHHCSKPSVQLPRMPPFPASRRRLPFAARSAASTTLHPPAAVFRAKIRDFIWDLHRGTEIIGTEIGRATLCPQAWRGESAGERLERRVENSMNNNHMMGSIQC